MKATVLICEPEVIVRSTLSGYLRDCGYLVIEVAYPDEAVTVLVSKHDVGCVLANVTGDSGFTGFHLAQWARVLAPDAKVLLVASVKAAADRAAELCRERHDLNEPPLDPQVVVDRIRQLLGARARRLQGHEA